MTVNVIGQGFAGTWGPPATRSATVFVNQNGSDSLSGDTPANAKLTLAGAVAALPSGPGFGTGTIMMGYGQIAPGSGTTITMPTGAIIQGQGVSESSILWATDLGSGVPGIQAANQGFTGRNVFRDFAMIGPAGNDTPTPGVVPTYGAGSSVAMWGLETGGNTLIQDMYISGFYANCCIGSNHEEIYSSAFQGGWYNLYFVNSGIKGNQTFTNLILYTAALASIGFMPGTAFDTGLMNQVGCGQAPFGVYAEANTTSEKFISNSLLWGMTMENIGNGYVYDATLSAHASGSGMANNIWYMGGAGSIIYPDWYASAYPSTYSVDCVQSDLTVILPSAFSSPGGPGHTGVFGSSVLGQAQSYFTIPTGISVNGASQVTGGLNIASGANITVGLTAGQTTIATINGQDSGPNLLVANDASLETSVGNWSANTNCAVAQSATTALSGANSLKMTSTSTGQMLAQLGSAGRAPVQVGWTYTAMCFFQTAVTAQSCQIELLWFNGSGTQVGSTVFGNNVTDATTGWAQSFVTAVAPATAVTAGVRARVDNTSASSEIHFVDCIGVFAGTTNYWNPPGVL